MVGKFSKNMKLIESYINIKEAVDSIKCSNKNTALCCIRNVCNQKQGCYSYKGFVWRFTDEYTEEEYIKDCNTNFAKRPAVGAKEILRYDLYGNLIAKYESTTDAVRKTGFSKSSIQACLYGKQKFSHDSIWKYNN